MKLVFFRSAALLRLLLFPVLAMASAAFGQGAPPGAAHVEPEAIPGLRVLDAEARVPTLGSSAPGSPYKLQVDLSGLGASILKIQLTDYKQTIDDDSKPFVVNEALEWLDAAGKPKWSLPFEARTIRVNGKEVYVNKAWELLEPNIYRTTLEKDPNARPAPISNRAVYVLKLVDENDQPVLDLRRTYLVEQNSYELRCEQKLINRYGKTLHLVWHQYAQGDIPNDDASYLGDRRYVVAGYYNLNYDPNRLRAYTDDDDDFVPRAKLLQGESIYPNPDLKPRALMYGVGLEVENDLNNGIVSGDLRQAFQNHEIKLSDGATATVDEVGGPETWRISMRDEKGKEVKAYIVAKEGNTLNIRASELVWIAAVNRYFAAAVHLPTAAKSNGPTARALETIFPNLGQEVKGPEGDRILMFTLTSDRLTLDPGQEVNLDLSLFMGPRKSEILNDPPYDSLELSNLIRYSLGGPCTFFTFQWLARGLLAFLKLIHAVIFDWGIAIIILVICVRLLLHPITKKAQVNMTKMGKQMAQLQPEVEKIKKKYKDDQKSTNQEMMKLYREKGINPANMLGCLPMFLQMPIWIALYAMLYYAIELRHVPAFYGIFQAISGGRWQFLADLSSADHFVKFSTGFTLPLIFVNPTIDGINVLPVLWGVAMFFQQKYMSPPPATDQAAQQQKMMKWMMLLFPFMLYAAPSGLTLYILASTAAGALDSYMVRQHIKKEEEAGTLIQKKNPPKPGGFRDRLFKAVEAKQKQLAGHQESFRGNPGKSHKKRKRR